MYHKFLDGPGCVFIAIGMIVVVALAVLAYVYGPAILQVVETMIQGGS